MIIFLFLLFSICNAYNESLAKHAINLSQSSYCVSSLEQWNCTTCESSIKLEYIVENKGSKALQGYDKYTNSIFIAFRGSSNIHNWIENIRIRKISPYNNTVIKVEKGFYDEYNYIKFDLLENIYNLVQKYNTYNIFITGHSSGAAMATLMTYDIITIYRNYTMFGLIQFGSPRVGNKEFIKDFNKYSILSYRITHYYDMVPHIPEEFLGYRHISNEIWYNENNSIYKICDNLNNTEDNSCSNSCSPLHCTSTSDHLNYINITMGRDEESSCYLF